MISIPQFAYEYGACPEGVEWAYERGCKTMQDVWDKAPLKYLYWIATRAGVCNKRVLRCYLAECVLIAADLWPRKKEKPLACQGLLEEAAAFAREMTDSDYYSYRRSELHGRLYQAHLQLYEHPVRQLCYIPMAAQAAIDRCVAWGAVRVYDFTCGWEYQTARRVANRAAAWLREHATPCFDEHELAIAIRAQLQSEEIRKRSRFDLRQSHLDNHAAICRLDRRIS